MGEDDKREWPAWRVGALERPRNLQPASEAEITEMAHRLGQDYGIRPGVVAALAIRRQGR